MTASRFVRPRSVRRTGVCIAAGIALALPLLIAAHAHGAIVQFAATIDGAQETPPSGSPAMATGTFTMDTDANTLAINIIITVPPPSGEIAAHIHGFSSPGTPSGILFGLPLGSPKMATWNFTQAQEPNIIAGLTYANIHSNAFPGGEIRGQVLRVPSCGDGIVDGGEDCDDGNTNNGDCCSSVCTFEVAGSSCTGTSLCSASGQCDGAGGCAAAPRTGCGSALKSILLLKNDTDDTKDKLIWKWIKGSNATAQTDFGVPTGTTETALCIYAGTTNTLISDPDVAGGPGWAAISDKGYKFKDSGGAQDGIQKIIEKSGATNKAKALVKGKGTLLPDPTLSPSLSLPVTAQLVNSANSNCFEGVYNSGDVIKNDGVQFKAKAQ